MHEREWVQFMVRFEILDVDRFREMAPITWCDAPIAAVTDAG